LKNTRHEEEKIISFLNTENLNGSGWSAERHAQTEYMRIALSSRKPKERFLLMIDDGTERSARYLYIVMMLKSCVCWYVLPFFQCML